MVTQERQKKLHEEDRTRMVFFAQKDLDTITAALQETWRSTSDRGGDSRAAGLDGLLDRIAAMPVGGR